MRKSNQILQNFFYKIHDDFILNTLYILLFMIKVPAHKERLLEILNINNENISLNELTVAATDEIQYYKGLHEINSKYLMEEIITGTPINVINGTPAIWCFISLYWAYDFKHKDQTSILSVYNPRIGDIALKFLLYTLKMKEKEAYTACTKRGLSFYADISPRLVRIIDILPVMDKHRNSYLTIQYFSTSKLDLALNFLDIQINNPWEQAALYVKSEKPNNTIRYKHHYENINLTIQPSRMAKDGAFNDLNKTYNKLMQLFNLDLENSTKYYGFKNIRKRSYKKIILVSAPIIETLKEELIYVDSPIEPDVLFIEDQIECQGKRKVYRRDTKNLFDQDEDSEDLKEYVTPNAFKQHKRNIAFSSKLSKERLLLKSDYDIPTLEHLKAFIISLNTEKMEENMKTYTGFFILSIALGAKPNDLIDLLQENKNASLHLENGAITVDIDSSLFAEKYSDILSKSDNKLTFTIPIMMTMLITVMRKSFSAKEFKEADFFKEYKKFLTKSVQSFPKRIIIKGKKTYRYLVQYVQETEQDLLTSKLATGSYTQNDTAGLAYTSTRSDATEHSQLIKEYWDKLNLDEITSIIIELDIIPSLHTSNIASKTFSGTSQAVEVDNANAFFKVLRQNIYKYHHDDILYFNLVSIYTRYAMSLLSGTRPFYESANFTSYNNETGMWMISEKAQDIASGTRLVPLCNIMNTLLTDYQKTLEKKGLKNNFYLIIDTNPVIFSSYEAHKFLQATHDLDDHEILKEYIKNVPLNSGRHLFTKLAIEHQVNAHYISTYLGHYSAGEEQFGIYSTLDIQDYYNSVKNITEKIAHICGIKEL